MPGSAASTYSDSGRPPGPDSGPQQPLQALCALVLRDNVGLGGLPGAAQDLVLGLIWAGMPDDSMAEAQVNEVLQAQLAGPAVFLDTDHVELRRRLVDAGWMGRDRAGRAYQRTAAGDLGDAQRVVADALAGTDTVSWVASQRAAMAVARQARRAAWLSRAAGAPAADPQAQ